MTQRGRGHSAIAPCWLCERNAETRRGKLEKRLAEVNARIAAYPYWGAALTALDEERRGLEQAIANIRSQQDEDN